MKAPDTGIEDLQMRLTYQEEDLRQLNLTVSRQQQEIHMLRLEVQRLTDMILTWERNGNRASPGHEPPPHY